MKYNPLTRRMFLQGSGGFLLTIPLMPSLLPKSAHAASTEKRLVTILSRNGIYHPAWYPQVGATKTILNARERALTDVPGPISTILGDDFTPLKEKLLLIRGLDGIHGGGHNTAGILGANIGLGAGSYTSTTQTIDQIISKKIYSTEPRLRILHMAATMRNNNISFYKSGDNIFKMPAIYDPRAVFEKLIGPTAGLTSSEQIQAMKDERKSIIDRVYEQYQALNKNPRLSLDEKRTLDDHLTAIRDVEKKISNISTEVNSCSSSPSPLSVTSSSIIYDSPNQVDHENYLNSLIDLIVLTLRCDLSRVISFHFCDSAVRYGYLGITKDSHSVSHNASEQGNQWAVTISKQYSRKVAELITKINNIQTVNGANMLDNTVVFWGHEFSGTGERNHDNEDMPVLVAGGGGFLKTNRYIDYQRPGVKRRFGDAGIPYNQFLVTLLQGFGLTPAEYEQGSPGFGIYNDTSKLKAIYDLSTTAKRTPLHAILK